MATFVLLDLVGGVALLLWGLHMVQSGIVRAFGSELRRLHSRALGIASRSVAYPVLDAAGHLAATEIAESDPVTVAATKVNPT
jgi:phosphate:Na+ symporter